MRDEPTGGYGCQLRGTAYRRASRPAVEADVLGLLLAAPVDPEADLRAQLLVAEGRR